jgi:hypothetical protein
MCCRGLNIQPVICPAAGDSRYLRMVSLSTQALESTFHCNVKEMVEVPKRYRYKARLKWKYTSSTVYMFLIQEFQCTNIFLIRFTWFRMAEGILILFSFLFVCSLTTLSVTHLTSKDWMIVNNELKRTWKEAFVA